MNVSMLLLIILPLLGGLAELIVNLFKNVDAFDNARPKVKLAVGLVVSLLVTFAASKGITLTGTSLATFTNNDIATVLGTIITWALAQLYHNGKKVSQLPPATNA